MNTANGQARSRVAVPIPPERTFAALATSIARTYLYDSDEARRRSWENALAMRRDAYLMSLLRERQLPVCQTPWHLEPDDPKDANQKNAAIELTNVIERTEYLTKFFLGLLEAVWYGKSANQVVWGAIPINGRTFYGVIDHRPINGDKLIRQYDGTWCVQVNPAFRPAGADVVPGLRGSLLRLSSPWWRERFVIHQHELDDSDFYEWEMAGAINGVGLRSRVAWCWDLRDEMLAWAVSFMEKVGTMGLLLFYYEEGNAKQKTAAEQAARDVSHTSALAVPIKKGGDKRTAGVDMLPASTAGVVMLKEIIQGYFETHMERLIVGQSMSSGADNESGLGGSGRAAFAADTKYQILKFDAANASDSLTRDFVKPLQRFNRPLDGFGLRFVFDVPDPAAAERLDTASKLVSLGLELRADDVRQVGGYGKPNDGDETIGGQVALKPPVGKSDTSAITDDDDASDDDRPGGQVLPGPGRSE